MKVILAPVDFSDASINSVAFAAELSKRSSARLVIVNILQKVSEEEETKNKLKSIVSDLKKTFGSDLDYETSFAHGNLITTLKKMMAYNTPTLL